MTRRTLLALLAALALVLGACGDDDGDAAPANADEEETDATASFPVTIAAANGEVTIAQRPERIVSLSPTATEMLFAIGAGDQVVAVDELSNHPEDAPTTDLSGFTPNLEAIAGHRPDLVVISTDPGDLTDGLAALGIPALQQLAAETLDDTYAQMEQLGAVTGNVGGAADEAGRIRSEIDGILADLGSADHGLTYYHEVDDTLYTATSSTFIGQLYALAGLENIADAADDGSGFPQLSAEFIVDADPDLIFLANAAYGESLETVAARPGWHTISAVENENVVELDPDLASRWGPRLTEQLRTIVDAVNEALERVET